jgi:hypothetical protein
VNILFIELYDIVSDYEENPNFVDAKLPESLSQNSLHQINSNHVNNRSRTLSVRSSESVKSEKSQKDGLLSDTDKPAMETQNSVSSTTQEEKTNSMYHVVMPVCSSLL